MCFCFWSDSECARAYLDCSPAAAAAGLGLGWAPLVCGHPPSDECSLSTISCRRQQGSHNGRYGPNRKTFNVNKKVNLRGTKLAGRRKYFLIWGTLCVVGSAQPSNPGTLVRTRQRLLRSSGGGGTQQCNVLFLPLPHLLQELLPRLLHEGLDCAARTVVDCAVRSVAVHFPLPYSKQLHGKGKGKRTG